MPARLSLRRFDWWRSISTSGSNTAKGSSPTTGRAHKMACPKPLASACRTEIMVSPGGVMQRTSSSNERFRRASSCASNSKLVSKWFSMEFLLAWVTRTISLIPAAAASSITYWISGRSTTGSISLGIALVAGSIRVPRPATGITAFLICMTYSFPLYLSCVLLMDRRENHSRSLFNDSVIVLIQQRQNLFGFALYQFDISPAFGIQTHHRLGVGHAQVKAPVVKLQADTIGCIDGFGLGPVLLQHPLNGFGRITHGAVDFARRREARNTVRQQRR